MKRLLRPRWLLPLLIAVLPLVSRAQTQWEMNLHAAKEAETADRKLNATYQKLLPKLDPIGKRKLIKAEQAWIAFRDAQCDFEGDWYRGGTALPMQVSDCQKRMTDARIQELETALDVFKTL